MPGKAVHKGSNGRRRLGGELRVGTALHPPAVVGAFEEMGGHRRKGPDKLIEEVHSTHLISSPDHEQHRSSDAGQVGSPQRVGPAEGVKRIGEEGQRQAG